MKKILIVDDQPQVRELVAITFQIGDYQILFGENGQEALEIAETEHPDVILLDVVLYGSNLDGLEVCRRLKQNPATRDIPVILLTGGGQKSDLEAGKAAGADDYFTKPFSPMALMKKIEAVVG
ncbi:MAG TPA: response regulator [Anaerolineae bacterium]|nr:response regulator [Anaerolineae bacterium]